jgi:threonine dehydrogenase-like Zn-dependent dehydrogenase
LWGGYSQYQFLHPNTVFHKVPAAIPAAQATLALPLGNGIEWAVLQGGASIGKVVVIQGPGQQGLACAIAAKEAGASCIIVTGLAADSHRLALAKEMGAHHTINIEEHDLLETVAELTNGHMADLVIDCASGGPGSIVAAIQLARKAGKVLVCGRKGKPIPEFESDMLFRKFLTVKGMRGHSYQAVEMALQIIASGRYPIEKMCTHGFGLGGVEVALRTVGGQGEGNAIHCSVGPWE